jgi:cell wall-associated NlpC family hydrolase
MSDPRTTINSDKPGHVHTCIVDRVPMRGDTGLRIGKNDSELLFGERFSVYDARDGIAYGQNLTDNYVGHVPMAALQAETCQATHVVAGASAFLFEEPTMRSNILGRLSMGAVLNQMGQDENGYMPVWPRGWVRKNLLQQVGHTDTDPVTVAEKLLGTPYQWGGRGSYGIDCSGFTQLAFARCGLILPRDTDMQEKCGVEVSEKNLQRGDLIFCAEGEKTDHVVMYHSSGKVIEASATYGNVVINTMADRFPPLRITGIRRMK